MDEDDPSMKGSPVLLRTGAWPFAKAMNPEQVMRDSAPPTATATATARRDSHGLRLNLDAGEITNLSAMLDAAYARIQNATDRLEERVRQRTAELEYTRARLATILDTISDALVAFDADGQIESINGAAAAMFRCKEDDAIGRPIAELIDEPAALVALQGANERQARRLDGSTFRVEITVRHVATDGDPLHVARMRDLTEARYTRKVLDEQAFLLEKSRSFMLTLRADRRIEWCNPCFLDLTGYKFPDLVDHNPFDFLFDDHTPIETIALIGEALGSSRAFDVEVILRHASGRPFWVHMEAYPMFDDDGRLEKFVALGVDITERKRQEQMQVDFVAMVSHELRTPLTVISGTLDALGYGIGGELPERALELVSMGQRNCVQLSTLIEDLLDVNKLEAGQIRFESRFIDATALVDETVGSMRPLIEEAGLIVKTEFVASEARVFADPSRLRQVLTNLLSNAIKFSAPGATIRVSVAAGPDGARIEVEDQGQGIPAAFQGQLFRKFSRDTAVQASGKEGFGLGLFICKGLVEQMGGEIGFSSIEKVGSTFFVVLPCAAPAAQQVAPADAPACIDA